MRPWRAYRVIALIATSLAAGTAAAQSVQVELRDGRKLEGILKGYDDAAQAVVLRMGERLETISWSEIRDLRRQTGAGSGPVPFPFTEARSDASLKETAGGKPEAVRAFREAQILAANGNVSDAETGYRTAAGLDPWFVPARFALVRLYLDTRRPDDAIAELNEVRRVDPRNVRALELLERAYEAKGWHEHRHRAAVERLRATYEGAEADYRVAQYWRELGSTEEARRAWEAYRKADPDLRGAFCVEGMRLREGEDALGRGDYARALARFHESLRGNPFLRDEIMDRIQKARWAMIGQFVGDRDFERALELWIEDGSAHSPDDLAFIVSLFRKFAADVLVTGRVEALAGSLRRVVHGLPPAEAETVFGAVLGTLVESRGKEVVKPAALLGAATLLAEIYRSSSTLPAAVRPQLTDFCLAAFRDELAKGAWQDAMDFAQLAELLAEGPAEARLALAAAIGTDLRGRLAAEPAAALRERIEIVKARLSAAGAVAAQDAIVGAMADAAPAADAVLGTLPVLEGVFETPPRASPAALARLASLHVLAGDGRHGAGDAEGAAAAYARAAALDPALRTSLVPRILEIRRVRHNRLLADRKLPAALDELAAMRAADPANEALHLEWSELLARIGTEGLPAEKDAARRQASLEQLLRAELHPAVRARMEDLLDRERATAGGALPGLGGSRYLPLRPGAWYRYRRSDGLLEEIRVEDRVEEEGRARVRLQKMTRVTDTAREDRPYDVFVEALTLYQDADGIYTEDHRQQREYLLKLPVLPSLSWERRGPAFHQTRRCLSLQGQVSTPKGTFTNCLIVQIENVWSYGDRQPQVRQVCRNYYAPHVGLVKVEFERKPDQDQAELGSEAERNLLLEDYRLPIGPAEKK